MKLPKKIVVTIEGEGREQYLRAETDTYRSAELGAKKKGGIYVLKEAITIEALVKTTRTTN